MEKSYQLLPLVGVNQAPNQFAYVEVVRVVIVDAAAIMLGDGETTVHRPIFRLVVYAAFVDQTLHAAIDWLVRGTIGWPVCNVPQI